MKRGRSVVMIGLMIRTFKITTELIEMVYFVTINAIITIIELTMDDEPIFIKIGS